LTSWNGYQYEAGQSRVLLGFLAFSQVYAHDAAALAYHHGLCAVGWVQRAQVLQVGWFDNVAVEVAVDLFDATQGVDVEGAVVPDHVATAVLAVNVTVLHAQESPIEETRREVWMALKRIQQDIDRTGMTWDQK
jgi:hypothetical protein